MVGKRPQTKHSRRWGSLLPAVVFTCQLGQLPVGYGHGIDPLDHMQLDEYNRRHSRGRHGAATSTPRVRVNLTPSSVDGSLWVAVVQSISNLCALCWQNAIVLSPVSTHRPILSKLCRLLHGLQTCQAASCFCLGASAQGAKVKVLMHQFPFLLASIKCMHG
jgi:hypothetical protein